MNNNISIILLAAGLSRRMGTTNKLLLPFRGTTLVEYCAEQLLNLPAGEIIVVTGHQAPEIQFRLFDRPFTFTYNPRYKNGMTSSIQQGVSVCSEKSKGVLICQSDMPGLQQADLKIIMQCIEREVILKEKLIVAPVIGERMGNPVFFSSFYFNTLMAHSEPNGCKALIRNEKEHLVKVKLKNKSAFSDVDTLADYSKWV